MKLKLYKYVPVMHEFFIFCVNVTAGLESWLKDYKST